METIDWSRMVRVRLTDAGEAVLTNHGIGSRARNKGEPLEVTLFELMKIFGGGPLKARKEPHGPELIAGGGPLFDENKITLLDDPNA